MDQEYKERVYSSMFDEMDYIQANRVYSDEGLHKLGMGKFLSSAGKGFRSLGASPSNFMGAITKSFKKGKGGVIEGAKEVMKTPEGKALAAGSVGLGVVGGLASRNRPQGQVVVAR